MYRKIEIEIELKMKYKFNKVLAWVSKLMNRKIEIEDEVTESECKNEEKKHKPKYWHKCLLCSHWHSTKS